MPGRGFQTNGNIKLCDILKIIKKQFIYVAVITLNVMFLYVYVIVTLCLVQFSFLCLVLYTFQKHGL
jgi:hypothetical protein